MAVVRLSDAYVADVYNSYTSVNNPETSRFVVAGVVRTSELFTGIARDGGKNVTVPFWLDIDPEIEQNYSNDDPADLAVPNKIGSDTMTARKAWINQGFSAMDLVSELAGSDPLQHIKNRFGTYWTRRFERRVIAQAVGVLADNVANDGGDMQIDISAAVGDLAKFGSDAFIDAAYTAGDQADQFRAIAVHSSIEARMVKNDEVVFIPDSKGALTIPTYRGRVVISTDNMPVTGVGADRIYTSILFGTGAIGFAGIEGSAFGFGQGIPQTPSEVERTPAAGNGGGQETIWERKTWLLHPFGFEWIEGTLVEFSPTDADCRLAAHWNRVVSRKQVPLAFIKSKA
ncbi:MAG: phage coat protein [Blastocatellia bacterium]|nr:phage coat protein [Blastocatellia bacterium]